MPRTVASIDAEIAAVDAAITKVLEAQSYSVAGRSATKASYESLVKRRDLLQQQRDRANGDAPMLMRSAVTDLR